jgi:hypothetical protein
MAITLLKRAGEHDVRIAGTEVEVAWTTLAALMALGPNFVRPHLPQLLVLWRNALPKPTSKDAGAAAGRGHAEWGFLLHVRESALGAVLCFLRHNSGTLVTLDVARRIASVLSNALLFANNFISPAVQDALGLSDPASQQAQAMSQGNTQKGLPLPTREALLRRRVHQCFAALGFSGITDATQATLLQSCVTLFASPDGYAGAGSAVQAAIAASAGTFTGIWASGDGYGHGVTFIGVGDEREEDGKEVDKLNRDSVEVSIDSLVCCTPFFLHRRFSFCYLASQTNSGCMRARSAFVMPSADIKRRVSIGRAPSIDNVGGRHGHRTFCAAAASPGPYFDHQDTYFTCGVGPIPQAGKKYRSQGSDFHQRSSCHRTCTAPGHVSGKFSSF